MRKIQTPRLKLKPISFTDFELFVYEMLTDPKVVEFFYSYKDLNNLSTIQAKAKTDFWDHFEQSRLKYGLEVWSARRLQYPFDFLGWCGLLHTELSDKYDDPELQFMISGKAHGKGYATELAKAVLKYAKEQLCLNSLIATVDIPNKASIKVLERLDFTLVGNIEAYGSKDMYLYKVNLNLSE